MDSETRRQDDAMARNFARSYGGEYPRTPFLARGLATAANEVRRSGVTVEQLQQRLRELSDFIGARAAKEKDVLDAEMTNTKRRLREEFTLEELVRLATLRNRGGDPNLALALYDALESVLPTEARNVLHVSVRNEGRLSDKWLAIARHGDYTVDGVIDAIDNIAREVPGVEERVTVGLPNDITQADLDRATPSEEARAAELEEVRTLRARLNSAEEGGVIRQALDAGQLDSVRIIADRSRSRLQFHLRKGHMMASPSYPINLDHATLSRNLRDEIADL